MFTVTGTQKVELNLANWDKSVTENQLDFSDFGIQLKAGQNADGTTENLVINKDGTETRVPITKAITTGLGVTAKYVTTTGETLKPDVTVKPNGEKLGTNYTATKEQTLTDSKGLVWQYKGLKQGSAGETGTITQSAQVVTFEYEPKLGKGIDVEYKANGAEIVPKTVVKQDGTQVGTEVDIPKAEGQITIDGKVYILGQNNVPATTKVTDAKQTFVYNYTQQVNTKFVD